MTQSSVGYQWDLAEMAHTILSPRACQILKYWIRCPEFLDENWHPVMLRTVVTAVDESWGFQYLVHEANPALAPAVILNELQGKEIVEMLDNDQILLKRSAYVVSHPQFESESYKRNVLKPNAKLPCRRYDDAT